MEYQRVQKIFNLIKPVLPTDTVSLFENFIDEYKQLLDLTDYNYDIIRDLRELKDDLCRKLEGKSEEIEELKSLILELRNDLSTYIESEYDQQKEKDELKKQVDLLHRHIKRMQQEEKEKDAQYGSLVEENKKLRVENKRIKQNNTFLRILHQRAIREIENSIPKEQHEELMSETIREKESLQSELEIVQAELVEVHSENEKLKEQLQYYYVNGYKQGRYEHRRRKY